MESKEGISDSSAPVKESYKADAEPAELIIHEVLPKVGLVFSEYPASSEVLCKPKILPLKSAVLQKLESLEERPDPVEAEPVHKFEKE